MRVVFLALALGVFLTAPRATQAIPSSASSIFGVDDGTRIWSNPAAIPLVQNLGVTWVRQGAYWDSVEATRDQFDWTQLDKQLGPIIQAGFTPVPFISGNPDWAANSRCGPIDTTQGELLDEFKEFVGALAARYPQVRIWILYNEADQSHYPQVKNDGCFGGADINFNEVPDYQEYAIMAAAAYDALHTVNRNARLALSVAFDYFDSNSCPSDYPCSPNGIFNYNFLSNLFTYIQNHPAQGPYADLIAFNYYDLFSPYWQKKSPGHWGLRAKAAVIRKMIGQAGLSFGLLVAEVGEDSERVGLDGQSRCLVMNMTRGLAAGLESLIWWTFQDHPELGDGWYYGLVDKLVAPKPSYTAYRVLIQQLTGYRFDRTVKAKQIEAFQFVNGKQKKIVAWSSALQIYDQVPCARERRAHKLTIPKVKKLRVVSLYGVSQIIQDNRKGDLDSTINQIQIQVDGSPRYIEVLK